MKSVQSGYKAEVEVLGRGKRNDIQRLKRGWISWESSRLLINMNKRLEKLNSIRGMRALWRLISLGEKRSE